MNKAEYIIEFESERLGYGNVELKNPCRTGIPKGVTVVVGENGSGKTTLGRVLEKGRHAFGNRLRFADPACRVKMLSFSDIHSLSSMEVSYFSQRMEATMNEYVPAVARILGAKLNSPEWPRLCSLLSLHDVEEKKVNYLSSGELRKLLIVNALLDAPDLLILDNPYIGLDVRGRDDFDSAMRSLRESGASVVMLLCDAADIPEYADAVIPIDNCRIDSLISDKEAIDSLRCCAPAPTLQEIDFPPRRIRNTEPFDTAFEIRDGHIRYGERVIFTGLDWRVGRGECWSLSGPNGAGKSLLLSLVCADNPQAYANDITLFDRRRGSGESIFEIKDRIGYISPEMQLFFRSAEKVIDIVVQGNRNSLNRYRAATAEELDEAGRWLNLLDIAHLAERSFGSLSTGEQRLVLMARAMIGHPDLLVLDEPFHGLDARRKATATRLIDALHASSQCALIFVTHYPEEIPPCVTRHKSLP